jgi:hypothetical protein
VPIEDPLNLCLLVCDDQDTGTLSFEATALPPGIIRIPQLGSFLTAGHASRAVEGHALLWAKGEEDATKKIGEEVFKSLENDASTEYNNLTEESHKKVFASLSGMSRDIGRSLAAALKEDTRANKATWHDDTIIWLRENSETGLAKVNSVTGIHSAYVSTTSDSTVTG